MKIANPNRICPQCGVAFVATHGRQGFCTGEHQKAFHETNKVRGQLALPLLQSWRLSKNGSNDDRRFAFAQLCALADIWNAEDKEAGRRPELIVRARRLDGWAAADTIPRRKSAA